MRMRPLFLFAVLAAGSFIGPAMAADAPRTWQAGSDYFPIDPPQPTTTGDKVEVLEVFSYACPHCAHFQPYADRLKAALPANARFELLPADFQPRWVLFARAFYVARSLGLVEKTHQALFDALWRDRQRMETLDDIAAFYAAHGADKGSFVSTAQSFVTEGELAAGHAREVKLGIDQTPTLLVNGKYRVVADSGRHIGYDEMVDIALFLVRQESTQAR
jgi:thiol:disulfide interchange protein DsbA